MLSAVEMRQRLLDLGVIDDKEDNKDEINEDIKEGSEMELEQEGEEINEEEEYEECEKEYEECEEESEEDGDCQEDDMDAGQEAGTFCSGAYVPTACHNLKGCVHCESTQQKVKETDAQKAAKALRGLSAFEVSVNNTVYSNQCILNNLYR